MISKDEYVKECWYQAWDFIRLSRKYPNRYSDDNLLSIERFRQFRKKYPWRPDKVERVFKFFRLLNARTIENEYKTLSLTKWEAFTLINLFGFYIDDKYEERLFLEAFIFIARKNGKTLFAVAVMLYMIIGDGEYDADGLLFARTGKQAYDTAYVKAVEPLINNSPVLKKLVNQRYRYIEYDKKLKNGGKSKSVIKTLGSDDNRLDGYNPFAIILDEIHSYPDSKVYDVCSSAFGGRLSFLMMLISTAGYVKEGYINDELNTHKKILRGETIEGVNTDRYFSLLFSLDEDDDVKDVDNWYKSNPSLWDGLLRMSYLKDRFNKTLIQPSLKTNFLTKHLNIFTDNYSDFIPSEALNKVIHPVKWDDFSGFDCYAGLDLSNSKDITALSLMFHNLQNNKYYFRNYYLRALSDEKKIRKNGKDLTEWINNGFIKESSFESIDIDSVLSLLTSVFSQYNIKLMGYDVYNAPLMIARLTQMGLQTKPTPQGVYLNASIKFLEEIIYSEKIIIDDNPVNKWMFNNVVIKYKDGNDYALDKNKSKDSIDGVVAMCMAIKSYFVINTDVERNILELYNNTYM